MLIVHRHLYLDFSKEQEFRIRPISDTQLGSPDVDESLVKKTLQEIAEDPLCVSLGGGDILDADRPTTRARRVAAYAGRERELSDEDMKYQYWIDREIVPMLLSASLSSNAKRGFGLIGHLDGHHFRAFQNGMTSTEYIIQQLKAKGSPGIYLGEMSAYVILHVHGTNEKSHQGFNIVVHIQHGSGGSQFISSDVASLERKTSPYFVADIFLRGHSTKRWVAARPVLYPSASEKNPQLLEKTLLMVNMGGYMRGYGPGPRANYVESAGLAPVTLGHVVIRVRAKIDSARSFSYVPEFKCEF